MYPPPHAATSPQKECVLRIPQWTAPVEYRISKNYRSSEILPERPEGLAAGEYILSPSYQTLFQYDQNKASARNAVIYAPDPANHLSLPLPGDTLLVLSKLSEFIPHWVAIQSASGAEIYLKE